MNYLGEAGYLALARKVLEIKQRYIAGIEAIGGFHFLGEQPLGVIAYSHEEYDLLDVADRMSMRGWYMSRVQLPAGLQHTITPIHEVSLEDYLADLRRCLVGPDLPNSERAARVVTTY
ncbi:hypothetical protein QA640_20370 [Bradyrhizobium sp. CB82]|uniref:hypothetical protein n=1 Tax=Bradyrhizobium sp. CB82 TaxID=3039159 RepID=UPI0024B17CD6|nr:hypothetical protein [Bradyrhizobium sp. CB82]WFU44592.1 hypothetical protein QA640_20370 [Bradyrhizobium sp. CB82]